MKHGVVFAVVVLAASAAALGQAWEGELLGIEGDLKGMIGITWDSKYIWRGFDVFDNVSATHFLADLNLFETGVGLSVAGHRANSSGFEDRERWDYTVYYQNGCLAEERYATNYRFGWVWYNYPELNRGESLDLQEGHLILSWPKLLGVKDLVPSYVLVKLWPADSGSRLPDSASGWAHIFMLDYGFTIPGLIPEIPEHLIKLHSELVFNDGVTPTPAQSNPDQDWSNAVFGVSTDLAFGDRRNIIFTPAAYYQVTLDKSINEDSDELWGGIGLKYEF